MPSIKSAQKILELIGMPDKQCAELPALTLLAMADIDEQATWDRSTNNWIRIHDIIQFVNTNYRKNYAENSRETFRKQAIQHCFRSCLIRQRKKKSCLSIRSDSRLRI